MHTFIINTTLLKLYITPTYLALKGPSFGSKTDTFQQHGQQNELPDVKLSLMSTVRCIIVNQEISHIIWEA